MSRLETAITAAARAGVVYVVTDAGRVEVMRLRDYVALRCEQVEAIGQPFFEIEPARALASKRRNRS